jgi:hypothetical protein
MNNVARIEADRLAADTAKAKLERIVREFSEERYKVVNAVSRTNNAAGYLPALIKWAAARLQTTISAQADAYIEAFNACNLPCDESVERKLRQTASEFTAGSIANVRGDRSVKRHHLGLGSPWHLEIEREMHTSVKEAIARVRHQSAVIRNRQKEIAVSQTFNAIGPNARNNINSTDNSTNMVHERLPFTELRNAIQSGMSNEVERAVLLEKLSALETAPDRESASQRFQAFVSAAADYMTLVGPFLPALGHWVHSLAASLG